MRFEGEALRWSLEGTTLEVALHRAPCNELGSVALGELERLADLLEEGAGGARAVLLYSTVPRGFCAGADLRELYEGMRRVRTEGGGNGDAATDRLTGGVGEFLERIHRVFHTLDTTPRTTVAAVHGFCFGGGFELALTCDVIVADQSARFCFPELRLGLVPGFGGIPRLRRDVGNAVVRDLLLTGRSLGSERAHAAGLISQRVGRGKALDAARGVARQAARFDPATTAAAKRFAKPVPEDELARERQLFLELLQSSRTEDALARFVADEGPRPYLP